MIKVLSKSAVIVGIIVTAFFLLAVGPKLIGSVLENGMNGIKEIGGSIINWYDNPTGFFITYFVGYAVIWKSKLVGSLIILIACVVVTLVNLDNMGWIIFTLPAAVVSILHLLLWNKTKRLKNIKG